MFKVLETPLKTTRNTFRSEHPDLAYVFCNSKGIGYEKDNCQVVTDIGIQILAVSSTDDDSIKQLEDFFFDNVDNYYCCSIHKPMPDDYLVMHEVEEE